MESKKIIPNTNMSSTDINLTVNDDNNVENVVKVNAKHAIEVGEGEDKKLIKTKELKGGLSASKLKVSKMHIQPTITNHLGPVPIRKPSKNNWFKVMDGEDWEATYGAIVIKDDNEMGEELYLTTPDLKLPLSILERNFHYVILNVAQYVENGQPFVIPSKVPPSGKETDKCYSWYHSQREMIEIAKKKPILMFPIKNAGGYTHQDMAYTPNIKPIPEGKTYDDIIDKAFEGRIIDSLDHKIIKKLLGQQLTSEV